MREKKKYLIGGLIIVIAIISLIVLGLRSCTLYYQVHELLARENEVIGQTVRVEGEVAPDLKHEVGKLYFDIIDSTSQNITLPVAYQGPVPDAFQAGRHVVVEGKFTPRGVFEAESIITRCPSKYQPEGTSGN